MAALPSIADQSVFPRHRLRRHDALTARNQSPSPRPKRPVQDPPVLDLRQVHDPIRLDLDVVRVRRRLQDVRYLLRERLRADAVEGPRPVDLVCKSIFAAGLQLERLVCESALV